MTPFLCLSSLFFQQLNTQPEEGVILLWLGFVENNQTLVLPLWATESVITNRAPRNSTICDLFIYLWFIVFESQSHTKRGNFSICYFISQVTTTTNIRPGQSLKLESSWPPILMQWPKHWGDSSLFPQVNWQSTGLGNGAVRIPAGTLMWCQHCRQ